MDFAFLGVIAFFNFAVIIAKLNRSRYADATIDVASLFFLNTMFAGSFGGAVVATVASAVMSIYLFFTPLTFLILSNDNEQEIEEEDNILAKYGIK